MTISKQLYADNAKTTLASIVSSTDTTISVVDGSKFPSPGAGEYFLVTIEYGGVLEIIKVQGKSGNTFTSCIRGFQTYTAAGFPAGARIESRTTGGTLQAFARLIDRVDSIPSVDLLNSPNTSNSNSYLCHSNDDSGNPVFALLNQNNTWRFTTHSNVLVSGAIATVNSTGLTSTAIANNLPTVITGKYIIQFVSGVNTGFVRTITASSTNSISWATPLDVIPSAGDQFEIYKSDTSTLKELIAASGVAPSDPLKANLAGPTTFTGLTTITLLKIINTVDTKVSVNGNTTTTTLDLSTGSAFKVTIAANTAFVFINAPTGTDVFSFTLITVNDATAGRAMSFPGTSKYAGGLVPPRTTAANAVDVWSIYTDDAGASWNISLSINDLK
jgi:hypothetical protein